MRGRGRGSSVLRGQQSGQGPIRKTPSISLKSVTISSSITKVRKLHFSEWLKIISDLWILDTGRSYGYQIYGYQIESDTFPYNNVALPEIQLTKKTSDMITSEVEKLTMKGAVRKVGKFISKIFLVPKRIPLSDLLLISRSWYDKYHHFKQENVSFALDLIRENVYLTFIYLTDAYFSITINKKSNFFLSWKSLCTSSALLWFSTKCFIKVLKPVYAFYS